MIKHIEHNVGTVELAKKLNEVIRIMNEGNPNTLPFDRALLYDKIIQFAVARQDYGFESAKNYPYPNISNTLKRADTIENEIKGMLGL